jgi:predicted RNA-binding protein
MVCDQRNTEANHNLIDFESRRLLKESEKLIQKSIQEWLNYHSEIFCFRVNVQGVPLHDGSGRFRPSPHRGVADLICSVKGHFLAIEVKSKSGKQSAYQKTFQEYVEKSGGHYIIARDLVTVMNKVDELLGKGEAKNTIDETY